VAQGVVGCVAQWWGSSVKGPKGGVTAGCKTKAQLRPGPDQDCSLPGHCSARKLHELGWSGLMILAGATTTATTAIRTTTTTIHQHSYYQQQHQQKQQQQQQQQQQQYTNIITTTNNVSSGCVRNVLLLMPGQGFSLLQWRF